jgi:hypothetical protein
LNAIISQTSNMESDKLLHTVFGYIVFVISLTFSHGCEIMSHFSFNLTLLNNYCCWTKVNNLWITRTFFWLIIQFKVFAQSSVTFTFYSWFVGRYMDFGHESFIKPCVCMCVYTYTHMNTYMKHFSCNSTFLGMDSIWIFPVLKFCNFMFLGKIFLPDKS